MAAVYYVVNLTQVWLAADSQYDQPTQQNDPDREPRVAIVLGAAQYNGLPSPVLQARLDTAVSLYEGGQARQIVVTGGGQVGDITTEAKTGYDYLRAAGIPDEDLLLEVQGGSTFESLAATARFLSDREIRRVIVVTDGYHVKRSELVAVEVGLEAVGVASSTNFSVERIVREGTAIALGRLISFRRLQRLSPGP